MITRPTVTVFMTAYNAGRYIEESIQSVLNQTYTDFELIIVDDGSTDDTFNIIARFNDPRIRVIRNENNKGLVFSRNIALSEAKGKFLAILDSDDIALPDRLQVQVKEFLSRPDLALLGTQAYHLGKDSKRNGRLLEVPIGPDLVMCKLLFFNTFIHSSVMMKTEVFRDVGGYGMFPFAEDYDLMIRISRKNVIDNLGTPLVEYRTHDTNVSQIHAEKQAVHRCSITILQLEALNISGKPEYIEMLIEHPSKTGISISDYHAFFNLLIQNNRNLQLYPKEVFEKILFDLWYEAVLYKTKRDALYQLFNAPYFNRKHLEPKQLRRAFKRSIKSIFN